MTFKSGTPFSGSPTCLFNDNSLVLSKEEPTLAVESYDVRFGNVCVGSQDDRLRGS